MPLPLSDNERAELLVWADDPHMEELALRAELILLYSAGLPNKDIVETVGYCERVLYKWVKRYAEKGKQGLVDLPRTRRPNVKSTSEIVTTVLELYKDKDLLSDRVLATMLGVSKTTANRINQRVRKLRGEDPVSKYDL